MLKPFYALSLFILASCNQQPNDQGAPPFSSGKWVDLSYDLSEETLYWSTAETFRLDTAFEGITPGGYYYSAYNFCAAEHGGTHLDAPVHFAEGKWSTDQIPLENLTGEAVMIDISDRAMKDPDYQITTNDIKLWEEINGVISENSIVLFLTGYGAYYPNAEKYLGTDERGAEAVAKLHFPGIHPTAAEWLIKNRKIKAVGLDVASTDYGQSKDFKTHRILSNASVIGFENIANLDKLPPRGAYIVALPMKIKGGSGAPLRIIAWIKD